EPGDLLGLHERPSVRALDLDGQGSPSSKGPALRPPADLTVLPAVAAVAALRRAPQHRPIVLALWMGAAIEIARTHLPARPQLALLPALPALSAWSTVAALLRSRAAGWALAAWLVGAGLVMLLPHPKLWWTFAWIAPFAVGCAVEAIAVALWWRRGRLLTV